MKTEHKILTADSRDLSVIEDESIDLVVTSPPYPMIQMWDELFSELSGNVKKYLDSEDGDSAFEMMHLELDKVWRELYRVTREGSFVCINIGDATRTIGKKFQLYSNHARIISSLKEIGFNTLPLILWRKQTNAPNKFMGAGMLPAGAYVTLEHEYILIFRKGEKRTFNTRETKKKRMQSSFFQEERNVWFSDTWDFKGIKQNLNNKDTRSRSAAFPFELAYRLINMYSLLGDTVLDPFTGTGTTNHASIASARNSIGIEIDNKLRTIPFNNLNEIKEISSLQLKKRILTHETFINDYIEKNGGMKYINSIHKFPVVTKQETEIELFQIIDYQNINDGIVIAEYAPLGSLNFDLSSPVHSEKIYHNPIDHHTLFE